jgi:hypothetical protein
VDAALEARRADLLAMGFTVRHEQDDLFVASRSVWYWDCLVTKMSFIVLVRRVGHLDEATIRADHRELAARATVYDPSALPRGFQKGRALAAFYVCDSADEGAVRLARTRPALDFASFTLAGLVTIGGQQAWYEQTPFFGAVYYAKFHHLMRHLVQPGAHAPGDPLSVPGVAVSAVLGLMLLSPCCCLILPVVLH